jgi:dihydropyrimidinase
MMHAENGIAIDVLAAQAVEKGLVDPVQHGLTRPKALEAEATFRAIKLAEVAQSPLYIVHLSADAALEQIVQARDRGAPVFAETCPQYLYLSLEEHLSRPGEAGAAYVCSPPLRSREDGNHDNLWRGLRTDDLSVVATDHCPFCLEDQKAPALGDFRRIPNGLGSVEHRLDLLHQGVVTGEIGLPRWVELCSTTPARLFGLYPRKGVIAPGGDADLVVYDPTARQTLGVATHHMNLDHSAYEGIEVTGQVETVLSRGSVVLDERRFTGRRGHGTYLRRGLAEPLR